MNQNNNENFFGTENKKPRELPSKPITVMDLLNQPKPKWIIPHLIPEKSISVIYGEAGTLKTFFVLDLLFNLNLGTPFLGSEKMTPKRKSNCLYLYAEGESDMINRVEAWIHYHKILPDDLSSLSLLWPMAMRFCDAMDDPDYLDLFIEQLIVNKINVLAIDTLAKNFGGDENSTKDMSKFLDAMGYIKHKVDGLSIIIVHHTGKDTSKGMRGNYALYAGVDVAIELGKGWWHTTKTKCSKPIEKIHLYNRIIELGKDDDDLDRSSLVVTCGNPVPILEPIAPRQMELMIKMISNGKQTVNHLKKHEPTSDGTPGYASSWQTLVQKGLVQKMMMVLQY